MRRTLAIFGGLALVLFAVNGLVIHKEYILSSGTRVYLKLAPKDPRSLIQGDYMRLDYAIARELQEKDGVEAADEAVIRLDQRGVASLVRVHRGEALGPGELLLDYLPRGETVRIASAAFFFQEGTAERYEEAAYGEVRVSSGGKAVLVGLANEALEALGPDEEP